MNTFEIKQMQERLEQQDENIWFMEGYFEQKKLSAEAAGNKEAAAVYADICTMIEHVKDDESLKKIYLKQQPRGSFKTGGGKWHVACWECKQGINGQATCASGLMAKSIKAGCFSGQLLDKFIDGGENHGNTNSKG